MHFSESRADGSIEGTLRDRLGPRGKASPPGQEDVEDVEMRDFGWIYSFVMSTDAHGSVRDQRPGFASVADRSRRE